LTLGRDAPTIEICALFLQMLTLHFLYDLLTISSCNLPKIR